MQWDLTYTAVILHVYILAFLADKTCQFRSQQLAAILDKWWDYLCSFTYQKHGLRKGIEGVVDEQ